MIALIAAVAVWMAPPPAGAQDRPVLELSLQEAVERTLQNNVDIAVEKLNPVGAEEAVRGAEGVYDPFLSGTVSQTSSKSQPSRSFQGTTSIEADRIVYNASANQYLSSGARLTLSFNNFRNTTTEALVTWNPQYDSTLEASISQPLLRDFRIDAARQQLRIAKKGREISDLQFRQTVINTLAGIKQLYYDLIYAIDNLEAQKKSLSLAQKLLDENRIRVKVGTMAPLDVVQAEFELASREEGVIVAESAVADAEDAIKRAIFPASEPGMWALRIVPRDRPSAEPVSVDVEAAIRNALEKRTDVVNARKNIERAGIALDYARNQTLPSVDLTASYGLAGRGGVFLERANPLSPVVTRRIPGSYDDALSQVFGFDQPTWSVGISFSYPLRNRQAAAAAAQSRIDREQAEASLRRLELQVASEVRSAGRAVETDAKRVASTRAARVLQAQSLDAEEKKFVAGMSTNFLVTRAQRDLAVAEVNELRAIADYQKSLINFERVQQAGSGGGGSFMSVSAPRRSGGSSAAAGAAGLPF